MKAQFLTACLATLTSTLFAQIQPGERLYGGSISSRFIQSSSVSSKNLADQNDVSVGLTTGKFRKNNWFVGLNLNAGLNAIDSEWPQMPQNEPSRYRYRYYSAGLNPFFRKYWELDKIQLFAGAGINAALIKSFRKEKIFPAKEYSLVDYSDFYQFNIAPTFELGLNYFLTKHLAVQLSTTSNRFPVSLGSVSAGLVYWTGEHQSNPDATATATQTQKGSWLIGGTFSVMNSRSAMPGDENTYTPNTFSAGLSIGNFVRDRTVLGLEASYSYSESRSRELNRFISSYYQIALTPYVQTYWLTNRLTPFHRISASWQKTQSVQYTNISLDGQIGLAYMLGDRFIIETALATLGLGYQKLSGSSESLIANASASLGNRFALRYVFR